MTLEVLLVEDRWKAAPIPSPSLATWSGDWLRSLCPAARPSKSVAEALLGKRVPVGAWRNSQLKTIPTVILTTSDAEADIVRSYELHRTTR